MDGPLGPFKLTPPTHQSDLFRRPIKYSKIAQVQELRREYLCSISKYGGDPRFCNFFQEDFYSTTILEKKTRYVCMQWVDWEHMEKQDDWFIDKVMERCEYHRILKLLDLKQDQNDELID